MFFIELEHSEFLVFVFRILQVVKKALSSLSMCNKKALLSLNTCNKRGLERKMKMSLTQKDKLEVYIDASQLISEKDEEESSLTKANDTKASSEKKKEDASEPIYLKRI